MSRFVIDVRDEDSGDSIGYYGGRVPKSVSGLLAIYEIKIVDSIDEAESFVVQFGAESNANSLAAEAPGKTFHVREVEATTQNKL